MTNTLTSQLMLVSLGLIVVSFQIKAATATATVSANIVPASQLVMSGSIVLNSKPDSYRDKAELKVNGVNIELSSFNSKNSAKLKVDSSANSVYDISISPSSTVTNDLTDKIEIQNIRVLNNFELLKNNKEHELEIDAMIKDPDAANTGLYFGTVEINVNYN